MNNRTRLSRRDLLKALGVGSALLPILEIDSADAACTVSGPKRMFILVWPNGMISKQSSTWATGTGATFVLPPFMSSLEPYRNDLILMDGIDYKFVRDSPNPTGGEVSGHACFQGMLTGAYYRSFASSTAGDVAGGISIDQFVGNGLKAKGYRGLTSLNLSVFLKSTARLSWRGAADPVIPDGDPYHVFSTLFAGAMATPPPAPTPSVDGGAPAGPSPAEITRLMRRSILDTVIKDINRFKLTVGRDDGLRIDSHLQNVRDLEDQLAPPAGSTGTGGGTTTPTTTSAGDCSAPVFSGTKLDVNSTNNVPKLVQMQMDLAIAAFAADATRVVVMQISDQGAANLILGDLGFKSGGPNGNTGDLNAYHSIAHRNADEKVIMDKWFQDQVAYLIGGLKKIADADGKTILDSSAVLAMNNMRTGIHEYVNVPAILAGSCGGYFKTGRALKLTNTPNNAVLVALANAMDVPTATFGEATYGGELTALRM